MKIKNSIITMLFLPLLFVNIENVLAADNNTGIQTERGWDIEIYDIKSNDYSYPSFRFSVKTPDGGIIGWDESKGKWTGIAKESSVVSSQPFFYPYPNQECTSSVEHLSMAVKLSSGIEGEYAINNALHCRNIESGENIFISSAYSMGVGGTANGKYEVLIQPNKYAVLDFCYSFIVENSGDINELCTNDKFNKHLIITPNNRQTLEITYNYTTEAEDKIKKVITPSFLINEWEGCYKLGCIKNYGLYTSINKKLEEAKKKYEAGDIKTSQNINNAVTNEINAQYDKGISKLCADILLEDLKY